ncbi:outer membrane assembly protein AsmA [Kluyvera ascorbata]|uniref:outer membrane assembly protein AsmA n=1 Tax=Kluyvera ascorbata TaxID=51288 RepID=UPI0018A57BAD|nr:outer membrane assembly protein AsmA [Kluyvera ascorbata]BBV65246.1 outer membrane assembly protein AsmA [Klebsiella sp. STW0522-44]MDU3911429.1 outer membrane assembly protein AsmA [Kluyvera ascorbata]MEB6389642.1 outer membrane assembly protein AsmA [Kluyvera ascorbata]UPQ73287.1 outer membrane assembly protein AsmA [Kluyvera ascorbata]HAT7515195.1 outer membrane assembly protein AsmA [Kluyvera ascorbata]
MRRILTTLMILLVVLVAGLSSLVLLVNPNDFRSYMVKQVEARSGYQLQLDGSLRWHVWPRLSILAGRMTLTAPGATAPLVRADNMRLDVALLPLLSHQLQVKQVMLKGAVIQLTPQTEAERAQNAPVAPKGTSLPQEPGDRGWSFDIGALQVVDSVLVFQHEDDEQVTVRDIRLQMEQDANHQAEVDFSGRLNRDQRDLTLSFSAQVQAGDYPQRLDAQLSQLSWQLQGADLPPQGISGNGSLNASWQDATKKLSFSNLSLTANDSTLAGSGSVILGDSPVWVLNLQSDKLNLDNLLLHSDILPNGGNGVQKAQATPKQPRPIIANGVRVVPYSGLSGFEGTLAMTAKQISWRGMPFTNVSIAASNQRGLLQITQLEGSLDGGTLSLPGTLDARDGTPQAEFQPKLDNIQIGSLLKAFNYPINMTGKMSLAGDFSGTVIDANHFRRDWQGQASIEMQNTRTEGLNFQQLVQQAVERSTDVRAQENYDSATQLDKMTTDIDLDSGILTLSNIRGSSSLMTLNGKGTLNLLKEEGDLQFAVQVIDGWQGQGKLIDMLKQTAIPLRVYGKWSALNYSLQVDQILRRQLQNEAKRRLNDWAERNKGTQSGKEVQKLLDKQ